MNNLIHTHTDDPLSKAICAGCILHNYYADLGKKAQESRKHITKKDLSKWASKGRSFLKDMTDEAKKEYFRKVRNGEKVK